MEPLEYHHVHRQPDVLHINYLGSIKNALVAAKSEQVDLIDKVLDEGYLEPPAGIRSSGFYRIGLTNTEKRQVLDAFKMLEPSDAREREYWWRTVQQWTRCLEVEPIPWSEAIETQCYYDLRCATLEEFQSFLFDHDVADRTKGEEPWCWDDDMWIDFEEEKNARLFIELFEHSDGLLGTFSRNRWVGKFERKQLNQGLWAAFDLNLPGSLYNLVWDSELDLPVTVRLIHSVYDLYAKLYAFDPIGDCCHMFWDAMVDGRYSDRHRSGKGKTSEANECIHEAMFATLAKILRLDSEDCQDAALHGLGHLQHCDTETLIQKFIDNHPRLSKNRREYAVACIHGDIL